MSKSDGIELTGQAIPNFPQCSTQFLTFLFSQAPADVDAKFQALTSGDQQLIVAVGQLATARALAKAAREILPQISTMIQSGKLHAIVEAAVERQPSFSNEFEIALFERMKQALAAAKPQGVILA